MRSHIKRLTAPKTWTILRKTETFLLRPKPGAHTLKMGMPLGVLLRDILKLAKTMAEAKKILAHKHILVDNIRRTDIRHLTGLLDVISIKETKEHFRVMLNTKGQLEVKAIAEKEAMQKPKRITNKSKQKGGSTQLNYFDGTNMIIKEGDYKVGDTVLIEFPGRIAAHYPLTEGAQAYITGGKHIGSIVTVEGISGQSIACKTKTGKYVCKKQDVFVIGDKQPCITIGSKS
jgi:small subunit ribosomal protein S4e